MARIVLFLALALCMAFASATPSFLYPVEHRSDADGRSLTVIPGTSNDFQYQLVPTDEYAVTENYDLSVWDLLPRPVTAVATVATKALKLVKWIVAKGSLILLGAVLVLAFCGLTPYCTLTFEKYPSINNGYRALFETNAMDQIQDFVHKAIEKYRRFQNA